MNEKDVELYKSKAKIEAGHNTVNVVWKCDNCGKKAYDVEIPKGHLTVDSKSGQAREQAGKQGSRAMRSGISALLYPIRRMLPFFLQGFVGDVENKVANKGRTASTKATLSKKEKHSAIDQAWQKARSSVIPINAFHGEIRCDDCVNK